MLCRFLFLFMCSRGGMKNHKRIIRVEKRTKRIFCLSILLFNKEPLKDGNGLTIRNVRSPPVGTLPRPPPSLKNNLHIASILVGTLSCVFIQLYCHFGMTLSWKNTKQRIIRCIWNSEQFHFPWITFPCIKNRIRGAQPEKVILSLWENMYWYTSYTHFTSIMWAYTYIHRY